MQHCLLCTRDNHVLLVCSLAPSFCPCWYRKAAQLQPEVHGDKTKGWRHPGGPARAPLPSRALHRADSPDKLSAQLTADARCSPAQTLRAFSGKGCKATILASGIESWKEKINHKALYYVADQETVVWKLWLSPSLNASNVPQNTRQLLNRGENRGTKRDCTDTRVWSLRQDRRSAQAQHKAAIRQDIILLERWGLNTEKRLQLFVKKEVQKWCSLHPEDQSSGKQHSLKHDWLPLQK